MEQALTVFDNDDSTRISSPGFDVDSDRDRIRAAAYVMQLLFLEVQVRRSRQSTARHSNQQGKAVSAGTKHLVLELEM